MTTPNSPPKPSVLLQVDTDPHPSAFDSLVAIDSGVDRLLRFGSVRPESVVGLVHGAIFTRGGDDLARTALFVGGSDAELAEQVFEAAEGAFLGDLRVSILFDPNGASTTSAAVASVALRDAGAGESAVVVGAGPVGVRVARLLARSGMEVSIVEPDPARLDRARRSIVGLGLPEPKLVDATDPDWPGRARDAAVLVSAGPPKTRTVDSIGRDQFPNLRVAVDLNAVPPVGVASIESTDRGEVHEGVARWGAFAVGAIKMKVHKRALRQLFASKGQILGAEQLLELARTLEG